MNYRHQFHAGNFADVMKHVLLIRLLRALQKKEKGLLYLDTHAGRGSYDLSLAARGDSLERDPEWPQGIGRLLGAVQTPETVTDYTRLVIEFDRRSGNLTGEPRFYPGSPCIARLLARPQDRLALVERQPAELAALRADFHPAERVSVHEMDGYTALRAMLPPPERRALVLIDPPFESQEEFAHIAGALAQGIDRFRSGVFAVWYPLTQRARVDEFLGEIRLLQPPPTLAVELTIAGSDAGLKMPGCGLLVINPPWQFDQDALAIVQFLAGVLAQAPGGHGRLDWLVRDP